ncbi:hypothetical protein ACIRPQ_27940 [Streptomyces sp. NPDC101213]|uniref:hypothetical protein n=1 Tax=Streptomyces sp. NPDC101213 TaxID=3366130 RepID=UPI0038146B47
MGRRHMWGKTAGALLLAVTAAAASGCSSDNEASGETKPASAPAPSFQTATTVFRETLAQYGTGSCPSTEPGTCWEQMQAVIEPTRTLRKAMNAEKSVSPEFWTEAYALIDTMEKGIAVGEDQGVPASGINDLTNRDDVFGSAHELEDWLDAHPIK